MSESVLPIFFSKSFIVSGLTLRSLIHVEFIFMYSAESVRISFVYISVQFSSIQSLSHVQLFASP